MPNPNINNASTIYANNHQVAIGSTAATSLVSNAADSGKLLLVDSVIVSNADPAVAVSVTVTRYDNAENVGTPFHIAYQIPIQAGHSLVVIDKTFGFGLLENQSLYVASSVANRLTVDVNWKEVF
jgi:hypothetical protein